MSIQGVGKQTVCPECRSNGRQAPTTNSAASGGSASTAKLDSLDFALGMYRRVLLETLVRQ